MSKTSSQKSISSESVKLHCSLSFHASRNTTFQIPISEALKAFCVHAGGMFKTMGYSFTTVCQKLTEN